MVTVRFSHSVLVDGIWYHVGDQVSLDTTTAMRLQNSGYVVILTGGQAPQSPSDPYPQYIDEQELADALAGISVGGGGGGGTGGGGTTLVEDPNDPGFYIPSDVEVDTPPQAGVPSVPGSFTVLVNSDTSITLAWTDSTVPQGGAAVTGYRIYNSGGTLLRTLGVVSTTTFTGLTPGTPYSYAVAAVSAAGESPRTAVRTVITTATVPSAPASLDAVAASDTSINLSWSVATVPSGGSPVTGYRVYSGSGIRIASLGLVTSYTHSGLTPGATYSYYVTAVSATGESGASVSRTVSTSTTTLVVPNAPTSLNATATGTSTVSLTWAASTLPAGASAVVGYRVFRGGTLVATVGPSPTSYTVTGLSPNTTYSFTVAAFNSAGQSALSAARSVVTFAAQAGTMIEDPNDPGTYIAGANTLTIDTSDDGTYVVSAGTYVVDPLDPGTFIRSSNVGSPNAPTSFSASQVTATSVVLSWTAATVPAGGTAVSGYRLYRDGALTQTYSAGTTTASIVALSSQRTYRFEVTAVNSGGESAPASVSVTTLPGSNAVLTGAVDPLDTSVYVTTVASPDPVDPTIIVTSTNPDPFDPDVLVV
jgi:fibronectin type 3 domain-containing protein